MDLKTQVDSISAEKLERFIAFIESVQEDVICSLPETLRSTISQTINFRKTLSDETDRGLALMAAAYIEDRLANLLRSFFVDDRAVVNPLFEFNGPFGTFSSKIDSAYALGLLPANVRRDIHLVRKIRNSFGHEWTPLSFSDEPIVSQCREFSLDGMERRSEPRGKFNRSVMTAIGSIEITIMDLEGRRQPLPENHDITSNVEGADFLVDLLKEHGFEEFVSIFEKDQIRKAI